jgi:hypothetical protein
LVIKTLFLVPVNDNAGNPFPWSYWIALENRLMATFGGFSQTPGVEGVWRAGDRVYRDTSRQYVVNIVSWAQMAEWLDFIRWIRLLFRQQAIYVEVAGVSEILGGEQS